MVGASVTDVLECCNRLVARSWTSLSLHLWHLLYLVKMIRRARYNCWFFCSFHSSCLFPFAFLECQLPGKHILTGPEFTTHKQLNQLNLFHANPVVTGSITHSTFYIACALNHLVAIHLTGLLNTFLMDTERKRHVDTLLWSNLLCGFPGGT